jgi:hypothetical protein
MQSKERIKILCKNANFVKDFIRYLEVRENAEKLIAAIDVIAQMHGDGITEYETTLCPARESYDKLRGLETAHSNLLEDVYGLTWHGHNDVKTILKKEGVI